jgi:hypothetical protein
MSNKTKGFKQDNQYWLRSTMPEGREPYFSHYYGVLTPLNQWWKNL